MSRRIEPRIDKTDVGEILTYGTIRRPPSWEEVMNRRRPLPLTPFPYWGGGGPSRRPFGLHFAPGPRLPRMSDEVL